MASYGVLLLAILSCAPSFSQNLQLDSVEDKTLTNRSFYFDDEWHGVNWMDRHEEEEEEDRHKRLLETDPRMHWPKGILPYKFISVDTRNGKDIKAAMATYEYFTPLRFHTWNQTLATSLGHRGFLKFKTTYGRGWSLLGFHNDLRDGQWIECPILKTCIHEIGHALGFQHEQYHPERDRWVRINKGNLFEYDTYKRLTWGNYLHTKFDVSSIMLYGPRSWNPMTLLFPEIPFEQRHFYMFQELAQVYGFDKYPQCAGLPIKCYNEGYVSVVDGRCDCICPQGLDPLTMCRTVTRIGPLFWPSSTFSLLQHNAGCPVGFFKKGFLRHYGTGENLKMSDDFQGEFTDPKVEFHFCTKSNQGSQQNSWPPGKYCFLKQGSSCPKERGIYDATVTIPGKGDTSQNAYTGQLPSGSFGQDTTLEFCCAHSGMANLAIRFPSEKPFILFAKEGDNCQNVDGMHVKMERMGIHGARVTGDLKTSRNGKLMFLHYCVYTPYNRKEDLCGGVIEMNKVNNSVTIFSDLLNPPLQQCTWLFKNSEGKGTIVFTIEEFKVTSTNAQCEDSLEIQPIRIAQKGQKFCGKEKQKSVRSQFGQLWARFTSGKNSKAFLSAKVKWVHDSDMCYNVKDFGQSYRGPVNYTRSFKKCLPWAETQTCLHNSYTIGDLQDGLEGNLCRNPDRTFRPWCYTKLDGCEREFCDVCQLEKPYDVSDDCATRKKQGQCGKDSVDCASTCEIAKDYPVEPVGIEHCGPPGPVPGGVMLQPPTSASVGEKRTYQCVKSKNVVERTCLTTGEWSAANTACLPCPQGYSLYRDKCYKFVDERVSYSLAEAGCKKMGAKLAMPKTLDEGQYIASIRYPLNLLWLGARRRAGHTGFQWADGTDVTFFHWRYYDVPHPEQCVYLRHDDYWKSTNACSWKFNYVCEIPVTDPNPACVDFLDNCPALVKQAPHGNCDLKSDLATYCRYSCDLCDTKCHHDIPLSYNTQVIAVHSNQTLQDKYRHCTWNVHAQSKKGWFLLHFQDFRVASSGDECVDSIEVRRHRYGPPYTRYCDANYKPTIILKEQDKMFIHFKTPHKSQSHFKAHFKWIPDYDLCYEVADRGWSYSGLWNFTQNLRPCLSWAEALMCENNTIQDGYSLENLDQNYCRNPDYDKNGPWCYNSECQKQYCDVCQFTQLADVSPDCPQHKVNGKCVTDPNVIAIDCPLTCLPDKKDAYKRVRELHCPAPGDIKGGKKKGPLLTSYKVGQKVTYTCEKTGLTVERTCLTSGAWTEANTACLACPYGFIPFESKCYKYFNQYVDKKGAQAVCKQHGAVVATPKTTEINHFISLLRNKERIWLGGEKSSKTFKWNDGTDVTWHNWLLTKKTFYSRDYCMVLEKDETWTDDWCRSKLFHFVCQAPRLTEKSDCADYLSTCSDLMKSLPPNNCEDFPSMQLQCRASCGLCSKNCNQEIELSSTYPIYHFSSNADKFCTWDFKGDDSHGQFVLTLDEFNAQGKDLMVVKRSRLDNPQHIFSSSSHQRTTHLVSDNMFVVFRRGHHASTSSFKATVRFIKDSDMCYNVKDNGQSYKGKVGFTSDFTKCLSWSKALSCPHNPLQPEDVLDNLEGNYCRNPDKSAKPWCYVNNCEKRYCDVCFIEEPMDVDRDCAARKSKGQCKADSAGCAKTCQVARRNDIKKVSTISCGPPGSISGAAMATPKSRYSVGEKVLYRCQNSGFPITRTCLTSGQWSEANTACLACPQGFSQFQGSCYKYFDLRVDYNAARKKCGEFNSMVAYPKTEQQNSFIHSISFGSKTIKERELWIGGFKNLKKEAFYWNDGTPFSWTAWEYRTAFKKAHVCVTMERSNRWRDNACNGKALPFVCQIKSAGKPDCKDFFDNCPKLLSLTGKQTCETGSILETYCRVTCGLCPQNCGETVHLSRSNPTHTISADRRRQSDRFCEWKFDAGQSSGRYVISIESLDIPDCVEGLEIRDSKYGKPLKRYCNANKELSLETQKHELYIRLRSLPSSSSHFTASIKWVDDEDMCYNVADKGLSYNGKMNHTESLKQCLPWASTLSCPHNPLVEEDFLDNLDGNYCRNPDNSDRPWCYVSDSCDRQFCDVCRLDKPKDMSSNCAAFRSQGLCTSNPKRALEECAATCNVVSTHAEPSVRDVRCKKPRATIPTGKVTDVLKQSYKVGETVTYKCSTGLSFTKSVCLTDGQWSDADIACYECPIGWKLFKGQCYKLVDQFLEYYDAQYECKKLNATVAAAKTIEINEFLTTLVPLRDRIWLGTQKNQVTNKYFWSDGTPVEYFNWRAASEAFSHRDTCVWMNWVGKWDDDWCNNKFFPFVCQMEHDDTEHCEDVFDKCPERIALRQDKKCDAVLDKFCHRSCTGCRG